MVSRLVLGCCSTAALVVEGLAERPGDLRVLCRDEDRVDTLRGDGVPATVGDPTQVSAIEAALADADGVDLAFVGAKDPERTRAIVAAARERLPSAVVVASLGIDASAAVRTAVESGADRVVDHGDVLARRVVGAATSEAAVRCRKLRSVLRDIDGRLAVVMHETPDPDAIASAVALARVAEQFGVPATPCYYGEVSHQENRALVNLLELDLRRLDADSDLSEFGGFALVDHSRPGINDGLPAGLYPDVVVDHHPPRGPVEAGFADLRSDVGATSTMLTGYLTELGVALSETVATLLLYGIRVDTADFTREVCREDLLAAATLLPHVDLAALEKVESPSVGTETIDVLSRAIRDRDVRDRVLVSYVGVVSEQDALAQAADRLQSMESVDTVLVYGRSAGTAYVSARSRSDEIDLGETLRTAFGQIGTAGGHAGMAGAQIPLGIIEDVDDGETLDDAVERLVADRFFEAVADRPIDLAVPLEAGVSDASPEEDGEGSADLRRFDSEE